MTQTITDLPDALNFEGLARRANYRIIAFREDVLIAFDRKDAAAVIYEIIYRWEDFKRDEILKEIDRRHKQNLPPLTDAEIEERMWVYMSYNDFARESGGAVSYNTVIAMLKYLIEDKKALEQRANHDPHYPDYEYRINKKAMAELLKALPVKPPTYTKVGTRTKNGTASKSRKTYTNSGTDSTNSGMGTTENGTGVYQSWGTSHNYTHTTHNEHTEDDGDDANAHHATAFILRHDFNGRSFYYHDLCNQQQDRGCNEGMTFTVMRLEHTPHDAQCDICYQPIHTSPLGSYSQQHTTGNALQNGEDHVLLPDHDHAALGMDTLHAAADTQRVTQTQQPTTLQEISNDENHSHEEIHDNGLSGAIAPSTVVAGRDTGDQDADRGGPSQGGNPDTRRLPVANSTASGDVVQGVRAKTGRQASRAAAAGAGGSANRRDVGGEVVPHQGQAQTDATPSLSVENSKPVGKGSKATSPSKKPKIELTEDQKHRARALKMMIEDRCGVLPTKGPNINENTCIALLVQKYADADIYDVNHYLFHCDFKWSKDENKYSIRGNIILEKMEPTLRLFAEKPALRTAEKALPSQKPTATPQGAAYKKLPPIPKDLPNISALVPAHVPASVREMIGR